MQAGIQISSVRKYLQNEADVRLSFEKVSAIGYRIIQIQWISAQVSDEAIADALSQSGMRCVSTQDEYEVVMPDFDRVLRQNKLWGSQDICVSGIPAPMQSLQGIRTMVKEMNDAIRRLDDEGMTLSFHPLANVYGDFEGASGFDVILNECDPRLKFVLDLYHTEKAGLDTPTLIRNLRGRVDMVHFKDAAHKRIGWQALVPAGQGDIYWKPIIEALDETGVSYGFAEQERWDKDAFVCLKEAFDYLTANGLTR